MVIPIIIIWALGFIVSFIMLRTEIASEGQPYTFGDRLLVTALSIFSWIWVIVILTTAWCAQVAATGYWQKEINPTEPMDGEPVVSKRPVKTDYN